MTGKWDSSDDFMNVVGDVTSKEADKATSSPDLLTKLTEDLLVSIALFLEPHEVLRLCLTCKGVEGGDGLGDYWHEIARQRAPPAPSSALSVKIEFSSRDAILAKNFIVNDIRRSKQQPLDNLLQYLLAKDGDTVVASSTDREEEKAENTLKASQCTLAREMLANIGTNSPGFPGNVDMQHVFQLVQSRCGCAAFGGVPCYWSSSPSSHPENDEHITYAFKKTMNFKESRIPCLHGLSVTPYKAYFHPDSPTYTPQYVRLQLLMPTKSDLGGGKNSVLYYESQKFELDGSCSPQHFEIDNVLFMGGHVRVVFSNFLQRQTLGEIYGRSSTVKSSL